MESTLCVDDELKEDEYDALNDETFGGAEADDAWEENHNVLAAQLEETIKRHHNAQHIEDIVTTSILQLGLDDEAATNGHGHLPSAGHTTFNSTNSGTNAASILGVGNNSGVISGDYLGGSSQRSPSGDACPPGFNGFFSRPTALGTGGSVLAGGLIPTGPPHPAPMSGPPVPVGGQLGHSQPPAGVVVPRPPTAVSPFGSGSPFPSIIGCPAVSAEQLEQQMLQASRAPQSQGRRMKTLGELEKEMVQESRRAILARQQQQQQSQQPPQQQQLSQVPPQGQQQELQRPPSVSQYRILRPQQQQAPFPTGPLQMIPPPGQSLHAHAPSAAGVTMGHPQRPHHSNQSNQIGDLDYNKKSQSQLQAPQLHPLSSAQPQHQQQPASHLEQHRNYRLLLFVFFYRVHDHYGFPDPAVPRPPPWEMNHNLHHNKWSAQPPIYPPPAHFQRPAFHQPNVPLKFMNFRESYRVSLRRHDDGRLPDWNLTGGGGGQRRYNTRDVETFGFDAVHEYQQEQDANKATRSTRSDDPYAGLMTEKEKEFVIRVQMMSLNMQAPHEQDYYYLEYMKRRSQGKAVCRNKLLTQRYERTPDRPHEPQQFENSLGKLHTVTAHAPKKILDMAGSRKLDDGDGRTVPANTDLLLFRKLLMDTEKSFSLLLKLEDPEVLTSHEEKLIAAQDLVKRLGPSPDNVLSLRKGRVLVLRSLAALWRLGGYREQCLQMLCSIIENLELILLKQKPLGDSVFVDKFDIIEDILRGCVPDEIARLQKCITKHSTAGDEVGEWVLRGKFGSMLTGKLAEYNVQVA
ncbi:uncharacterized protein LOC111255299 isoform X1 [Varroa destructor]|uniref:Uncharacterized protein n=1 Tax=Varroa destructor TaxID=109461 RepID=A0A7M7L2G7_VARDE|nr:uncharacterized protein LOC111255299 isoform X1 [Varroa destructor]